MYKIMIADDEGIAIDAMTYIINKNFGEECVIQAVKSGRDAIEAAEHFRPDIVLMDIQMPGINGIEAMEEIRNISPSSLFIVVSAYDNFDYAKEAIRLGAMCYVNKPLEKDEIVRVLRQAMRQVKDLQKKRSSDLRAREKLEIVVPIIENGFIYSMIFQKDHANSVNEFKGLLELSDDSGFVMVLQFGEKTGREVLENAVGVSVRAQGQYNHLRELVKRYFTCVVGALMGNMVTIYVPHPLLDKSEEYEVRLQVIDRARKMVRELSQKLDMKVQAAIGSVVTISETKKSYDEAVRSLDYLKGNVIHVRDLPLEREYEDNYPIDLEDTLFTAVEKGDVATAKSKAGAFFDWMEVNYGDYSQDVKLKVLEFVLRAEYIEYRNGGLPYRFTSRSEYLADVNRMDAFPELKEWFLGKVETVCYHMANYKEDMDDNLIKHAKEYIQKNFERDICLDEVSEQVQISPYYLSKLFKKETGENFIEYVSKLRMEKAKELLKDPDKTMKEISSAVGYSNPNYFSHTFRKNVGMSPSQYKEGLR